MNDALARAKKLLSDNRDKLDGLSTLLMEKETIDRKAFLAFMNGEELPEAPTAVLTERAEEKTE